MTRGTIGRRIGIGRCITVDERVRRRDGLMSRTKTPVLSEFGRARREQDKFLPVEPS